jgi:hypothetical protein
MAATTVLDILVTIDEKILTSPQRWTRGMSARTAYGTQTETDDPRAARFCLLGAVDKASDMLVERDAYRLRLHTLEAIGKTIGIPFSSITDFNDRSKFADVKSAIQRTIARLRR